jgi:hypothetical protein
LAFRDDGERWDYERRGNQMPAPAPPPVESLPTIPTDFDDPDPTPQQSIPDMGSFQLPSYTGPFRPQIDIGAAPQFRPDMFGGVSFDEAMNEPGFQFRLKSGTDALERSAAARGVLRTGGTLKDLVEYGQNFASNEYQNVFNRALQAYMARYQAQRDMFAPHLAEWQARAGAEQASGLAGFQLPYNIWAQQGDWAQRNEDRIMNTALPRPPADASAY